jgi:hypothetical protein
MHEDVERSDRRREIAARAEPEECRSPHAALEAPPGRAVADDHEPGAGELRERGEPVHLLLGSEAADITDDDLATGRDVTPHELAPVRGIGRSTSTPRAQRATGANPRCSNSHATTDDGASVNAAWRWIHRNKLHAAGAVTPRR